MQTQTQAVQLVIVRPQLRAGQSERAPTQLLVLLEGLLHFQLQGELSDLAQEQLLASLEEGAQSLKVQIASN
jgi:hypothetical protein